MPYFRSEAHEFVVHYASGKIKHKGRAQSFWYWNFNSTLAIVPMNVQDVPFVFSETTSDFQVVSYQGQASFRFTDPERALGALNLSVNPYTKQPLGNDLELLRQRVTNWVNSAIGAEIQSRDLVTSIKNFEEVAQRVLARLSAYEQFTAYGIALVGLVITSIRPTPEVAKAIEAELREKLLRKADEAIYARRTAAVEEERKIKEQEMATEVAMEERRTALIALESQNKVAEAEARGKALEAESKFELAKLKQEIDTWALVEPAYIAALGFKKLGESGASQVVVTTEVLSALLDAKKRE